MAKLKRWMVVVGASTLRKKVAELVVHSLTKFRAHDGVETAHRTARTVEMFSGGRVELDSIGPSTAPMICGGKAVRCRIATSEWSDALFGGAKYDIRDEGSVSVVHCSALHKNQFYCLSLR